jgi:hypothetical protein
MTVGGRRTVRVQPEQGFGAGAVGAPYAIIPGGSVVRYEVELLRLSRMGPDALMKVGGWGRGEGGVGRVCV